MQQNEQQYISKHPTVTYITKYEYTRLRGFRIEQLANGAIPYIHMPDEAESGPSDEPMTLTEIESNQLSLTEIFDREARAGVLPFQIGRAEKTFTTYRACMDGRGNMCTIELNCVEQPLPSAAANNEQKSFMVILQPSATVTEAVAKLSELLDAETPGEQATALVLRSAGTASGMQRLDSECTLWDYGITSNTDVYFE
jgi:hypothetical protein